MARDDRERNFEQALARNLRPVAPADSQPSACPDAEFLAAYHERLLSAEQMISWKEHIASCSRCQEVLAQLEATDEIPLDANQEEYKGHEVSVVSQPALPVLTLAGSRSSAPAAMPASIDKSRERRRKLLRPANWRWLAPAGAIAAILILWVAFHENTSNRIEVAKNQPAPASTPAAPAAAGQIEPAEPKQEQQTTQPASPVVVPPIAPSFEVNGSHPPGQNSVSRSRQDGSAALSDKAKTLRPNDHYDQKSLPMSGRNYSQLEELSSGRFSPKKDAGALAKQSGIAEGVVGGAPSSSSGAATPVPTPATNSPEALPRSVNETVEVTSAAPPIPQSSESVTVEPEVVNGVSRSNAAIQTLQVVGRNVAAINTITTPNQSVLWRVAAAGIVQRSADAGVTWTLQKSGVVADLLAGSAPSDKVCWLVGRAGTVLRTTDGGAHWHKVRSPSADDLSTVFAVDADQATVSPASNNKSYKTSDAGRTWTLITTP
jgi:hypothetical protein